ncbi:MAG: TolC family protein [Nitrospiraceae bacterium]|nr:TolC family protein [Nitrospiraceae bacterium]
MRCYRLIAAFMALAVFVFAATVALPQESLSLGDGLRMVTRNNRLVKIARRQEDIQRADVEAARAPMLPSINGSAGQTFLAHEPRAVFDGLVAPTSEKDYYSYGLNIQQTLYDFEGNASRYGASKAVLAASRYDTMRIRNLVALQFAMAYFDLLEAGKMVLVAEDEVSRLQAHLKDAQNLYAQGVITKNDLLQAEVRISDARQRLVSARNSRNIMASRVNNLLARPLDTPFEPVDIPENEVFYPGKGTAPNIEQAWENAQKNRPELAVVAETMKSLRLEKKAARSQYYPRFFARGGYDYTKNQFETPNGNFSLIIGMGINFYGGGATRAELDRINSQQEKLIEQKDKIVDDIKLQVETYALDLENARKRLDVTRDAVKQAKENLRINKTRYEEGVGTATDVLDALTLLTVAETNRYSALYDFRKAEAGYLYSQGNDLAEVYK